MAEFVKINSDSASCELLLRGASMLQLMLNDKQIEQLLQHLHLLKQWNNRINLTAVTDREEMLVSHVLDCLAVHPYLKGTRHLDLGSGAGFPGIPLAIARPDDQWTLLDSRQKKVAFVNHVVMRLRLSNVETAVGRIEDQRPPIVFNTLVSRAVASVADLVMLTKPLQTAGVRLLLLKGKSFESELACLSDELKGKISVEKIAVPFLKADRFLIIIDF